MLNLVKVQHQLLKSLVSELSLFSVMKFEIKVVMLRNMLSDERGLEEETGESYRDYGGSYVLPLLAAVEYDNTTVPLVFHG